VAGLGVFEAVPGISIAAVIGSCAVIGGFWEGACVASGSRITFGALYLGILYPSLPFRLC
jgi:hypothetical protein